MVGDGVFAIGVLIIWARSLRRRTTSHPVKQQQCRLGFGQAGFRASLALVTRLKRCRRSFGTGIPESALLWAPADVHVHD
jgi:hypothetical protein